MKNPGTMLAQFQFPVQQEIFFPESTSIADSYDVHTAPVHNGSRLWGRIPLLHIENVKHMKILHTMVRMSSAALSAAVTLPR